jgi:hypothetical protein
MRTHCTVAADDAGGGDLAERVLDPSRQAGIRPFAVIHRDAERAAIPSI